MISKTDFFKACINSLKNPDAELQIPDAGLKIPDAELKIPAGNKLIIAHEILKYSSKPIWYSIGDFVTATYTAIELKDNVKTFALVDNTLKHIQLSPDEDINYSNITQIYIHKNYIDMNSLSNKIYSTFLSNPYAIIPYNQMYIEHSKILNMLKEQSHITDDIADYYLFYYTGTHDGGKKPRKSRKHRKSRNRKSKSTKNRYRRQYK